MTRLALENVSVTFRVRQFRRLSLKEFLVRRMFLRSVNAVQEVHALENIDLTFQDGDRIGVIGHNGAGKSTLLKTLAGIYPPTQGRRVAEGRIGSLFDIALGFEHDSSGWENIAYRGYLQGETPQTIRGKMESIAEFSELGKFLDMPVRYYSSGMLVRLAFSIATDIHPEILLIDEALSAGDLAFQGKARQRMLDIVAQARIMVMVSHDLKSLENLCQQVVWMDQGRVREIGPTADVIARYHANMHAAPRKVAKNAERVQDVAADVRRAA